MSAAAKRRELQAQIRQSGRLATAEQRRILRRLKAAEEKELAAEHTTEQQLALWLRVKGGRGG